MRSRLLRIEVNLNSNRYIREVLQPEVLSHLQATPHAIFPATGGKDYANLLSKSTGITASLACTFARHIAHRTCLGYGPTAHTLGALWTRVQTAWRDIPQEDIRGLFEVMPRRIETLTAAHGGFTPY